MEPKASKPNIQLRNAYEEINFYESPTRNAKPVLTRSNGPADLAGIFANHSLGGNNQEEDEQVFMCAQPFYVGQVDHNIQQIGLMAVKEVRYVDEDQWQEMVKENQKYMKAMQKSKLESLAELKRINAQSRTRNQKGQFVSKTKKNKQIKKEKKQRKSKQRKSKQNSKKSKKLQEYIQK